MGATYDQRPDTLHNVKSIILGAPNPKTFLVSSYSFFAQSIEAMC